MRKRALVALVLCLHAEACRESSAQTPIDGPARGSDASSYAAPAPHSEGNPTAAGSPAQQATAQQAKAQQAKAQHAKGNDSTGRFVSHVAHIQPGGMPIPRGMVLRNPYEGNAATV